MRPRRADGDGAAELVPFPSIHETVMAVAGRRDRPRRSCRSRTRSRAGSTRRSTRSRSRRARSRSSARPCSPIRNCLIARERDRARRDRGRRVAPAAARPVRAVPARRELPGATRPRDHLDGRRGARGRRRRDAPWAALGPRSAAALTGAGSCATASTTSPTTRRASSGSPGPGRRRGRAGRRAPWKTSVVFAGAGDQSPGWLVRCLSASSRSAGVNLTRIESRPRRGRLGHYLFHVDMEGRAEDPPVADAIAALGGHCEEVRLLGSYPAA